MTLFQNLFRPAMFILFLFIVFSISTKVAALRASKLNQLANDLDLNFHGRKSIKPNSHDIGKQTSHHRNRSKEAYSSNKLTHDHIKFQSHKLNQDDLNELFSDEIHTISKPKRNHTPRETMLEHQVQKHSLEVNNSRHHRNGAKTQAKDEWKLKDTHASMDLKRRNENKINELQSGGHSTKPEFKRKPHKDKIKSLRSFKGGSDTNGRSEKNQNLPLFLTNKHSSEKTQHEDQVFLTKTHQTLHSSSQNKKRPSDLSPSTRHKLTSYLPIPTSHNFSIDQSYKNLLQNTKLTSESKEQQHARLNSQNENQKKRPEAPVERTKRRQAKPIKKMVHAKFGQDYEEDDTIEGRLKRIKYEKDRLLDRYRALGLDELGSVKRESNSQERKLANIAKRLTMAKINAKKQKAKEVRKTMRAFKAKTKKRIKTRIDKLQIGVDDLRDTIRAQNKLRRRENRLRYKIRIKLRMRKNPQLLINNFRVQLAAVKIVARRRRRKIIFQCRDVLQDIKGDFRYAKRMKSDDFEEGGSKHSKQRLHLLLVTSELAALDIRKEDTNIVQKQLLDALEKNLKKVS